MTRWNRRQFVRGSAAGILASGSLLGCKSSSARAPADDLGDDSTDGTGGSGGAGGTAGKGGSGGAGGTGGTGGGGSAGKGGTGGVDAQAGADGPGAADAMGPAPDVAGGDGPAKDVTTTPEADAGTVAVGTIIDTHFHFSTGQTGADYDRAKPKAVTGAILVESNWTLEQNQTWLDVAAASKTIVGVVGNISGLGSAAFTTNIARFAKNKLFRGIRVGQSIPAVTDANVAALNDMASKGLAIDFYQYTFAKLPAVAKLAAAVPDMHIVLDHMADLSSFQGSPPADWLSGIKEVAKQKNVYVKLSWGSPGTVKSNGMSLDTYRMAYDALFAAFGDDRVVFATNWPVVQENVLELQLAMEYITPKGKTVAEKLFWRNSQAAYGWSPRV